MSGSIYFIRECPICGRRVHIRIEYLGRQVMCRHCRGQFLAEDPTNGNSCSASENILHRAEELLKNVQRMLPPEQFPRPR